MDALPVEILLEIGRTGLATYVGMLAIPKFARAATIGYRLDMMAAANYDYKKLLFHDYDYDYDKTSISVRRSRSEKMILLMERLLSDYWEFYLQGRIIISKRAIKYDSEVGTKSRKYEYHDDGFRYFSKKYYISKSGEIMDWKI